MLRFLLLFLLFTAGAQAQSFDLSKIPEGFSFESQGEEELSAMRFVRRDGMRYIFEEIVEGADGTSQRSIIHTNNESQTTYFESGGVATYYYPHDCAPSMGNCDYSWRDKEGSFELRSITRLVGDVWVSETYFFDQGEWVFWTIDCTTYDEFGFWIDYVRAFNDGETYYGARVRPGENRIDELWNICEPPDKLS